MGLERCTVALIIVATCATRAGAYSTPPAIPLEQLARTADLVIKGTVVADRVVRDAWFEPFASFEVRETELRVVSVIKGAAGTTRVRFRHYSYAPKLGAGVAQGNYSPQHVSFTVGTSYVVFAVQGKGGTYHQVTKPASSRLDQGVLVSADATVRPGATVTEVAWAELGAMLASKAEADVVYAIGELDELSGGHGTKLTDFDRRSVLDAIRPMIAGRSVPIAKAAIAVFGADSPFFVDGDAAYWLAGMGKGTVPGLTPRIPSASPAADVAVTELLVVADGGGTPELRALAIRALGRCHAVSAARVETWSSDPDPAVRAAAVLVSATRGDRPAVTRGATDPSPDVRRAAGLAIGFAQDATLIRALAVLLADPQPAVRTAAALGLVSFAPDQVGDVLKANLGSEFRPLFINALARRDPAPYLALLAEVIEQRPATTTWWSGTLPAGDSWRILFDYVKTRPAAELTSGRLDRSLDALESVSWGGSSEPQWMYALYLTRGMPARASRFRAAARKASTVPLDAFFDLVDKSPATYVQ